MSFFKSLFGASEPGQVIPGLTLYHFSTCPYCVMVRRAAGRLAIDLPMKNIHQDRAAFDELVAGGGRKQVPCLRIERADGGGDSKVQWLYESTDIIEYLRERVAAEAPA